MWSTKFKVVSRISSIVLACHVVVQTGFLNNIVYADNIVSVETDESTEFAGDYINEQDGYENASNTEGNSAVTIKAYVMDECVEAGYSAYIIFYAEDGTEYSYQLTSTDSYKKHVMLPSGKYTAIGGIVSDNRRLYPMFTYQTEFEADSYNPVYFECLIGTYDWNEANKLSILKSNEDESADGELLDTDKEWNYKESAADIKESDSLNNQQKPILIILVIAIGIWLICSHKKHS